MNVFELTRALVDIESITENEERVGNALFAHLSELAARHSGHVERIPVEANLFPNRFNVLAWWGDPVVTLSTHMDTVPPFFSAHEDADYIYGRGSCDAKGILAAQVSAAERLKKDGVEDFALLFLVGEETVSDGAREANLHPPGSRYIINGEPTENKLVLASKGVLRFEAIAKGRLAHSAYPELGESAIEKLLDALENLRRVELPVDPLLGPSTMNIGTIAGGRAPNVIADSAKAEILVRVVGDPAPVRQSLAQVVGDRVELNEVLFIPAIEFHSVDGIPTTVVSYTTDVPMFNGAWGEPLLLGPGSIHVAHTADEHIAKSDLLQAIDLYAAAVRRLVAAC